MNKPTITCKKVWTLISESIRSDHQWEQIPGPVFKGLFKRTKEDMEDTTLDAIEDLVKQPHKS